MKDELPSLAEALNSPFSKADAQRALHEQSLRTMIVGNPRHFSYYSSVLNPAIADLLTHAFIGVDPGHPDGSVNAISYINRNKEDPPLITIDSIPDFARQTYTVNDQHDIRPVTKEPSRLLLNLIKRI